MVRPIFESVFEEDESVIRERMIDRISDTWRKEPGDFMHDAVTTVPLEIVDLQINQDTLLQNMHAQYAEGENMDLLLQEVGLYRFPAVANKRTLNITADAGVAIDAGHKIVALITDEDGNPIEYTVNTATTFGMATTIAIPITAVEAGVEANLVTGSEFSLVPPISGVRLIVDAGTDVQGRDAESDLAAWERYDFHVKNPDTGGNKNDYKRWASEVVGVGKSKVVPLWNGNGTVKVIIIDTEMKPVSPLVEANAQEYLDPGSRGLGEGMAPAGAAVTVISAIDLPINISADVTFTAGSDAVAAKTAFEKSVTDYLKTLALLEDPLPIVYNRIGAMFFNTPGISNYTNLLINSGTTDIMPGPEEVATLGVVAF